MTLCSTTQWLLLASLVVSSCSLQRSSTPAPHPRNAQPPPPPRPLPATPVSTDRTAAPPAMMARRQALALAGAGLLTPLLAPGSVRASETRLPENFGEFVDEPKQMKNGVIYRDFVVGKGSPPKYGQVLRVAYRLYLKTSPSAEPIMVDNTYQRKSILMLKHGNGKMIPGLEPAVHTMNVGGKRRVIVPPSLAYTGINQVPFPIQTKQRRAMSEIYDKMEEGGSVICDVELVEAFNDDADPGYYEDADIPPEVMDAIAERLKEITRAFI